MFSASIQSCPFLGCTLDILLKGTLRNLGTAQIIREHADIVVDAEATRRTRWLGDCRSAMSPCKGVDAAAGAQLATTPPAASCADDLYGPVCRVLGRADGLVCCTAVHAG